MKRRGAESFTWSTLMLMIVGAIGIAVVLSMFGGNIVDFKEKTEELKRPIHKKACKSGDLTSDAKDCDRDEYPDYCDRCIDGAMTISSDGDRMPDVCETEEGKKTDEIICRYREKGTEDSDGFKCSIGPKDCGDDMQGDCPETYVLNPQRCPNNELAVEEMEFVKHDKEEE